MKKYEVKMISTDNHVYVFKTITGTVENAIKNTKESLIKNGYERFGYKVQEVKQL